MILVRVHQNHKVLDLWLDERLGREAILLTMTESYWIPGGTYWVVENRIIHESVNDIERLIGCWPIIRAMGLSRWIKRLVFSFGSKREFSFRSFIHPCNPWEGPERVPGASVAAWCVSILLRW